MDSRTTIKELKQLYVASPAAYSTPQRLFAYAKRKGLRVSLEGVQRLMSKFKTYNVHRLKYKKAKHEDRAVVSGIDQVWQIDTCHMPTFQGKAYILLA